jgi:ribosomal protein S12
MPKKGMIALKTDAKKILKYRRKIELARVTEALEVSPQRAGAVLRRLGWENTCPYREDAIFVKVTA